MCVLGRILMPAIRFLAPICDVPLWLVYGLDLSLKACVPMVVLMGLTYVKLLSLTSSFALES